jgi:hypothetical protein
MKYNISIELLIILILSILSILLILLRVLRVLIVLKVLKVLAGILIIKGDSTSDIHSGILL